MACSFRLQSIALLLAVRLGRANEWASPQEVGLISKCGVAVSSGNSGRGPGFTRAMLRTGVNAGLAWHTGWSARVIAPGFALQDYGRAKEVPQFWGHWNTWFQRVRAPALPVMLGFNEPDQGGTESSSMNVGWALNLWMQRIAAARSQGYTQFVAPSIAQALPTRYTGVPGWGNEWLPSFLEACLRRPGCKESINFLGFHMYEPNCGTSEASVRRWGMEVRVGSLKKLAQEFNRRGMRIRGLWLTEFAGNSGGCRTRQQQKAWMEKIVPMLNAEPAVVAYSWFSYGEGRSPYFHDDANLFNYGDGSLTDLGRTYFNLCRSSRRLSSELLV
jgi:hypothetical protein